MRIFIAEDNVVSLMGLSMTVENMGHEVVDTASDGESACAKIAACAPELLLLDINMPKKTGLEVLKTVRETMKSSVPCIFITAYSDRGFIQRASELGAVGYVLKPVVQEQLAAQIAIGMEQSRKLQEANAKATQYKSALEDRKLIERAKGILMDRLGLKEAEAMKRLQKRSADENKKLVVIAEEIIKADSYF